MIKIAKTQYDNYGNEIEYNIPDFVNIKLKRNSSIYWELTTHYLKDTNNVLLENKWQFNKVYSDIPETTVYDPNDKTKIIWNYPKEQHVKNNKLLDNFWNWRQQGYNSKNAICYPVGLHNEKKYMYHIKQNNDGSYDKLNIIDARKQIYIPEYCNSVKQNSKFYELNEILNNGDNILFIDDNGPHQESLPYYIGRYNVTKDFIVSNTIDVSIDNMKILMNDPKHDFGYCYCLAMALFNVDEQWITGTAPTFIPKVVESVATTINKRAIIALSKVIFKETPNVSTDAEKFAAAKNLFEQKMKGKRTYVPLTRTREIVVNEDDYNLEDDLENIIKSNINNNTIGNDINNIVK